MRRLAEVERAMGRATDPILRGVATATLEAKLSELEAEKTDLEAQITQIRDEPAAIEFHPRMAEQYAEMVGELADSLRDHAVGELPTDRQVIEAVRGLVSRVVIAPLTQDRGGPIDIVVEGTLARLANERTGYVGRRRKSPW